MFLFFDVLCTYQTCSGTLGPTLTYMDLQINTLHLGPAAWRRSFTVRPIRGWGRVDQIESDYLPSPKLETFGKAQKSSRRLSGKYQRLAQMAHVSLSAWLSIYQNLCPPIPKGLFSDCKINGLESGLRNLALHPQPQWKAPRS